MAIAIGYSAIDMRDATTWYGDVTAHTTTHIQITSGAYVQNYYGSFSYDNNGLSGGTVTSTTYYEYGQKVYEISGGLYNALTIEALIDSGNMYYLFNYVFSGNDVLNGSTSSDAFGGFNGNDALYGNAGNDALSGGGGNDILDGGTGNDTLTGGKGDDLYTVDSADDLITELALEGTDTVRTTLTSYDLSVKAAQVEYLIYTGEVAFTGMGNDLANKLTGGLGNDHLDGGRGVDVLTGGAGNDTYVIDNISDGIIELAEGGIDSAETSLANYSLALQPHLENVTYTGTANFIGTGNAAANALTSGAGNDILDGGKGSDTLTGGAGNDTLKGGDLLSETDATDTVVLSGNLADYVFARVTGDAVTHNRIVTVTHKTTGEKDTLIGIEQVCFGDGQARLLNGLPKSETQAEDGLLLNTASPFNDTYVDDEAKTTDNDFDGGLGNDTITGGTAVNVLAGGDGNDVLSGGAGNDTLSGGAGNDGLDGGMGADTMAGGKGDDLYVVDAEGDLVTENVLEGTDIIRTTLAAYDLSVKAAQVEHLTYAGTAAFIGIGNDLVNKITGASGNDWLNGGLGADTLTGGAGNDTYVVDSVYDRVVEAAGEGTDTVRTELGGYSLLGLPNVENLTYTGSGNFAGTGNLLDNVITGGNGNDRLNGGLGNDTLTGNDGNDLLIGGLGDDVLNGGAGNNALDGGLGSDTAAYAGVRGDYQVQRLDNIPGGALRIIHTATGATDLVKGVESFTFTDDKGVVSTLNWAELTANTPSPFDDTLTGGDGNDIFDGGAGHDLINGGKGDDSLIGGLGNDIIDGGEGADTLTGGAGNDTYHADASDTIVEAVGLAGGTDRIYTKASTVTLPANVEALVFVGTDEAATAVTFTGSDGANQIQGALVGSNTLNGGAGNDALKSGVGNDTLDGGTGADSMDGGAGNDTYLVDNASDKVLETLGNGVDTVLANLTSYLLAQNAENLTYTGSGSFTGTGNDLNNVITGGNGNDKLYGLSGDDTLIGGIGADYLYGGAGNDTLVFDANDKKIDGGDGDGDVLKIVGGTLNAGDLAGRISGIEKLELCKSDGTKIGQINAEPFIGNKWTLKIIEGQSEELSSVLPKYVGAVLSIGGEFSWTWFTGDGDFPSTSTSPGSVLLYYPIVFNKLNGTDASNTISGTSGADWVAGAGGDDILRSYAGNDVIDGENGNDFVDGGEGIDEIYGGDGNDTLIGGLGADRFVFSANAGYTDADADIVLDFNRDQGDRFELSGSLFAGIDLSIEGVIVNATSLDAAKAQMTADTRLLYDSKAGNLYFDADGSGEGAAILLGTIGTSIPPASLAAADFGF